MIIYFCGSIRGGRTYADIYKQIIDYLLSKGHKVPTEHVARQDVLRLEEKFDEQFIYERDIQFLHECAAVIAEVSNPSLGVGYEICYALNLGKPTLCLYDHQVKVSCMISGNTSPFIHLIRYSNRQTLQSAIDTFLMHVEKRN